MENLYYQDGTMVKLGHSYLNQENYCSQLMILIIMELPQLLEQMIVKKLFLEAWKEK
jgi:hypothetical protein